MRVILPIEVDVPYKVLAELLQYHRQLCDDYGIEPPSYSAEPAQALREAVADLMNLAPEFIVEKCGGYCVDPRDVTP